jgi:hypothetical protein
LRTIISQIYALKRRLLSNPDTEIKSRSLLTRATFRRIPEKREFVEAFFDLCRNLPITAFTISMERPLHELPQSPTWLPNQFRYLLQRAHLLAQENSQFATILFDGDGSQFHGLPPRFGSYLFRSGEGQSLTAIADAPYYVDSRTTVGIQVADMFAGVVRIYQQNELFRAPPADPFLNAVRRYYGIVDALSMDLETARGRLPGMYRMPERAHYAPDQEFPEAIPGAEMIPVESNGRGSVEMTESQQ